MNIRIFQSFILPMILAAGTAWAQQTPLLERTVDIVFREQKPEVALRELSKHAGFTFSYNASILDGMGTLTGTFVNHTVREILDKLFEGRIEYRQRGDYIIMVRARASAKNAKLTGYVVDGSSGERLKDVSVYDPVTLTSAITDSYGFFEIRLDDLPADLRLSINKRNYSDTLVAVPRKSDRLLSIPIRFSREAVPAGTDSVPGRTRHPRKKSGVRARHQVNLANIRDTLYRKTQMSLLPFVGTNHALSGNVVNDYSLNIIGGYSAGVRRLEIGGLFNIVRQNATGVQISGAGNVVRGHMRGSQLGGLFNVAGELRGVQVSGLVNVASRVKGLQVGLINISDSLKGFPIGLLNIVVKGYHKFEVSSDEIFYTNLAFRTGLRKFHNIITAGAKPATFNDNETFWSFGYGFGTATRISRSLCMNIDITSNQIMQGKSFGDVNLLNKMYAGVEIRMIRNMSAIAGVTLNAHITRSGHEGYWDLFTGYRPHIIGQRDLRRELSMKMWLGGKIGLRFL